MKIAFSTNAYRNYSIEDSIRSIASIGYSGIELMCDTPHAFPPLSNKKIDSIKNTLKENKMEISNLNGFMLCAIQDFHHPSWIEKNFEDRQKRIEHTKNCIELAKKLDVKTVSTEPGGPPTERGVKKDLEVFSAGINEVLPIAQKNNVKLLIEPEPGLLVENSSQFLDFISKFDTKYLGLNFDIGHFFCVGENPDRLIKTLKDYLIHVHLEDISKTRKHYHLVPGTGAIDFYKIFDALSEINYKGYITIELYPFQKNPENAAREAMRFLETHNLN